MQRHKHRVTPEKLAALRASAAQSRGEPGNRTKSTFNGLAGPSSKADGRPVKPPVPRNCPMKDDTVANLLFELAGEMPRYSTTRVPLVS